MNRKPLLIIAAGGTGGHMFPAQALAEDMLAKGWRVKLSTDVRGNRYSDGFPQAVEREVVSSGTPSRGGILAKLVLPFRIATGVFSAWLSMRRDRPSVVVGFGGYPAIPAMTAAWLLRRPRMLHEQNGVLGRVNGAFVKHVDAIACSVWPTELPDGVNAVHTGNPVRGVVLAKAGAPYQPPGDHQMEILVIGGSQGASILSRVVPEAIALLPETLRAHLHLTQQARPSDLDTVVRGYEAIGVVADVRPFIDDLPEAMAAAQLVISRAGASSIADISVIGRPSILVPLAIAVRDEQTANARALEQSGGAFVLPESAFTPEALSHHIAAILSDAEGAEAMAAAALAQGKPQATKELAVLVKMLAGKGA